MKDYSNLGAIFLSFSSELCFEFLSYNMISPHCPQLRYSFSFGLGYNLQAVEEKNQNQS